MHSPILEQLSDLQAQLEALLKNQQADERRTAEICRKISGEVEALIRQIQDQEQRIAALEAGFTKITQTVEDAIDDDQEADWWKQSE